MDFYIRPIEAGDAKGINQIRRMPGVFEILLAIPSEKVSRTEEFIVRQDSNTHHFVAVTEIRPGEELVIGSAALSVSPAHACVTAPLWALWSIRTTRTWELGQP